MSDFRSENQRWICRAFSQRKSPRHPVSSSCETIPHFRSENQNHPTTAH